MIKHSWQKYISYTGVLLILTLIACTPGIRYKVLSAIFDGVPEPGREKHTMIDTSVTLSADKRGYLPSKVKKEPVYIYHPPFREKECDSCHEIERGNRLLDPLPDLCFSCHDDLEESYAFLHGPAASGNCTACHNPHMTKNKKLLRRSGQALCLYCHNPKRIFQLDVHEDIQKAECLTCHNAHGADNKYFLN